MPYLDAALAFALTMLAVATLVTQIVRLGQALAKTRSKVMREMLEEYFNKELKPVVDRELNRLKGQIKSTIVTEVSTHIDDLEKIAIEVSNRVENFNMLTTEVSTHADDLKFVEKQDEEQVKEVKTNPLFSVEELEKLVDMSTEEITERLKRSQMGQKLLEELGDKANTVFEELGKQYELVGKKFTKSFREHARWWATGVALVLAFALNIDTIFIAKTYISNEGMRQAVIAQRDSLEEGYTTLTEKFAQEQDKAEITREEFEQAFADTQEQLDIFTSAGFPIGWSYFPHSAVKKVSFWNIEFVKPAELSKEYQDRNNSPGWWLWVAGCILTGLLAGLGGPFWYDMVAGISNAVKGVRGQKN